MSSAFTFTHNAFEFSDFAFEWYQKSDVPTSASISSSISPSASTSPSISPSLALGINIESVNGVTLFDSMNNISLDIISSINGITIT